MSRILCVHLPHWPIQRRMVSAEDHRACVLTARHPRRGLCVVACSADAYEQGIRVGMPVAEAKSLATNSSHSSSDCPLKFEPHDPQLDQDTLQKLAQWCDQFSPLVGLETEDSPSSLLLDVTGLADLFGGEKALARQVVTSFQQQGYLVRIIIADSLGAAWAVSHFGEASHFEQVPHEGPTLRTDNHDREMVSQTNISSFQLVPPGRDAALQALSPLPLEALRLPNKTVTLLHDLGISRIEQLLPLPRSSLAARFGDSIAQRLDQALGLQPELIVVNHAPLNFYSEWPLEHPTHRRDILAQILLQLIERVASQLDSQDLGALKLRCRLRSPRDQVPPVSLQVALFQPTCRALHLAELIQFQLERATFPAQIASVSVQATVTAPLEVRQRELFADSDSQSQNQLAVLTNRLTSRLGNQCVVRAVLRGEAQPERTVRYLPPRSSSKRQATTRTARRQSRRSPLPNKTNSSATNHQSDRQLTPDGSGHAPLMATARPLQLLPRPVKLNLLAVAPEGSPIQFVYQKEKHHVARYWGPERIETGWWRGRSVRRDYYRVETSTGHRFWLYRQRDNGHWFLHGAFE
ncbi:MAG: DNA polymerase Y family protein [Pirellulaceae bacterium]|nr:DNA polymerase Y family protein [Pirellulaceae bacterium]